MSINIMFWNVKSLTVQNYVDETIRILKKHKVSMCGLVNAKLNHSEIQTVCDEINSDWKWESNVYECCERKILVGWDPKFLRVGVVQKTEQVMQFLIRHRNDAIPEFYCSFVNAKKGGKDRMSFWHSLHDRKPIVGSDPWVLLGNFNATLDPSDTNDPSSTNTSSSTNEFKYYINSLKMTDVPKTGFNDGVLEKVDRVMSNERFLTVYPESSVDFLGFSTDDHSPGILFFHDRQQRLLKLTNKLSWKQERQRNVVDTISRNAEGR